MYQIGKSLVKMMIDWLIDCVTEWMIMSQWSIN